MSFSVSVDKATVVNNEAYTITTTSSTTLHSVDVYMNQQYYDKRVSSFPSNSSYLVESGTLFSYYVFGTDQVATLSNVSGQQVLRIHNSSGSYIVDNNSGSTFGLGTPYYMVGYNDYLYILHETEGFQVFRYYLLAGTVTQDVSTAGLNACGYIASQCRAESKFTFGSNGICYLANGIYDGIEYYTTLMMINITTGYTQALSISTVASSYPAIAMDSQNYIYLPNVGERKVEKIELRYNGTYYNISSGPNAFNLNEFDNLTNIYIDPFDIIYITQYDGTSSTIKRYKFVSDYCHLISETLYQANISNAGAIQYSPSNEKLYIANNSNSTIYEYAPSFDTTFQYFYSPVNITLIGNLANGSRFVDLLKITQNFIVNNTSDSNNPRYQESGNSSYNDTLTLANRSEYMKNLSFYKDGSLVNDTNYVNSRYVNTYYNITSENPSNTCGDVYSFNNIQIVCSGSNVNNQVYLISVEGGGSICRNIVNGITPYDIYINKMKEIYVLHESSGTYYVAKYDNYLNFISQFTVEYNSGSGIIPRNICVDLSGNVYVNYDTKLKKYNSSGTFLIEVTYGSGSVVGRKCNIDKMNEYIYISDNSFMGFYQYPLSLASVIQITLTSPPTNITDFDLDIYDNFHIMDNNNYYSDFIYQNNGTLFQNMSINNYVGFGDSYKLRIYDHLKIFYLSSSYLYDTITSYQNLFNGYTSVEITSSESGNVTLTSTISFLDGNNKSSSYIYRNHTYNVNTSSTNISGNKNRISLNSTTDNNGNAILPERIVWWKDGVIKKESLREYQKVMAINDIEDPVAIAIDSDNYLYVLNDNTYTVDVYNTATLTSTNYPIVKSISLYNDEETLRDLFVDSNKNIYVLFEEDEELGEYILRKYNSSGELLFTLGPFDSPYSIYVDNLSRIYVADRGDDLVIRYDSSGNELNRFSFSNPRSVAVDSFYNIYIANDNTVYKYDFEFNILSDPYLSGYDYIRDMYIDTSNNLFITDESANKVDKYNSSGLLQLSIHSNLDSPRCTVVDSSNNIYIANYNNDSIIKYDSTGTNILATFKNNLEFDDNIAVDGSGNIYTMDNEYVYKYDTSYNIVKSYKLSNDGDTRDIICDRTNSLLYIAYYDYTTSTSKVIKLNTTLTYIQEYLIPNSGYLDLYSIALDNSNNLYISCNDSGSYMIKIYNLSSETVTNTINLSNEFNQIVVDTSNSNTIYVLNNEFGILYRYRYDGISSYIQTQVFNDLLNKRSIGIDADYLYIGTYLKTPDDSYSYGQSSGNNKVYKYTLASDAYTETFVYNAYYPISINVYNNNVYILEDPNGNYVRILQNNSQNIIKILNTQDYEEFICADSNGNIYVQNTTDGNNLIKYDSSGNKLNTFDILYVRTMCVDSDNNVYVASERYVYQYDRNPQTYIQIQKYNSSGTLQGTIVNEVAINDQYTFINYPLRDEIYGLTCDSTYLYVAMKSSPIIRFHKSTLILDYNYNLTGVVDPKYILYTNNYMYISNNDNQIVKYQLTSTNGTYISALNSGQNCQQFGVDSSGKIYIPVSDKILLYQSDMYSIYSSILSLDSDYLFIGPSNKIYVSEQDGSVGVYNQSVNSGYSSYYDATESGEYEIQVYFYDYEYDHTYEVTIDPTPDPETYIEYLQRIDLEMIPYYLYDAVLARNEAQIITLFKSNRSIVSKLVNFYQKMKNAHENPRKLNTPFYYNVNWYAKIRYDESQPTIPYLVGYQDMYFFYLYLYNKTVSLNMYYLLEVARKYYRTILQAQRAISYNQDTTVYYRLDSSITNNYLLHRFVNSFL